MPKTKGSTKETRAKAAEAYLKRIAEAKLITSAIDRIGKEEWLMIHETEETEALLSLRDIKRLEYLC